MKIDHNHDINRHGGRSKIGHITNMQKNYYPLSEPIKEKLLEHKIETRWHKINDYHYEVPRHINHSQRRTWQLRVTRKDIKLSKTLCAKSSTATSHIETIAALALTLIEALDNGTLRPITHKISELPPISLQYLDTRIEISLMLWGKSQNSSNPRAVSRTYSIKSCATLEDLNKIESDIAAIWEWRKQLTKTLGLEGLRASTPPEKFTLPSVNTEFAIDKVKMLDYLVSKKTIDIKSMFSIATKKQSTPLFEVLNQVGEAINKEYLVNEKETLAALTKFKKDKVRSDAHQTIEFNLIDADGNWLLEFDFSDCHNFPLPLLPKSSPKKVKMHTNEDCELVLYLLICVFWSAAAWESKLKDDKQNLLTKIDNGPENERRFASFFRRIIGGKLLATPLAVERELKALTAYEMVNYQRRGDCIELEFEDEYLCFALPSKALLDVFQGMFLNLIASKHDNKKFPILKWVTKFETGDHINIFKHGDPSNLARLQDNLRNAKIPKYKVGFPKTITEHNFVFCSHCGTRPKIYLDEVQKGKHFDFEIHCPKCNKGRNESSSGTEIEMHRAMIRWTKAHSSRTHPHHIQFNQISQMATDRVSIIDHLQEQLIWVEAQVDIIEQCSVIGKTFVSDYVKLPSIGMRERVKINYMWTKCYVEIFRDISFKQ